MCSRGLSFCDIGAAAMWMCNLKFHILRLFNFSNGSVGKLCITHLLDLQNFITEKLPDDGTRYEVCFEIYFNLITEFCAF